MENYIISKYGNTRLFLSRKAAESLEKYVPKGCPFKGYTLLDLVKDLLVYSWKVTGKISISDYIRMLQAEGYAHAIMYGNAIIECLEA